MLVLLVSLLVLALAALAAGWWRERRYRRRGEALPPVQKARPDGCCGKHAVCEKELLLEAAAREPEYFDDEELDAYRGRRADDYTETEAEEFARVLYTMPEGETGAWLRALELRGIALPEALRDEALMLAEDEKGGKQ
ncbi:MAG: phospholipase [Prevotellaceae bacterium]|nr:phospholipase [Prevotellaceae bacterium]